jgi:hypothetical protein
MTDPREQFYYTYKTSVYKTCQHFNIQGFTTEDIVQEIWIYILRNFNKVVDNLNNNIEKAQHYLCAEIKLKCISLLRYHTLTSRYPQGKSLINASSFIKEDAEASMMNVILDVPYYDKSKYTLETIEDYDNKLLLIKNVCTKFEWKIVEILRHNTEDLNYIKLAEKYSLDPRTFDNVITRIRIKVREYSNNITVTKDLNKKLSKKEYMKKYYQENSEKYKEKVRVRRSDGREDKEKKRENNRKYNELNKIKLTEYKRNYFQENKDKIKEQYYIRNLILKAEELDDTDKK